MYFSCLLGILSFLFCHRIYGVYFPFEGDVLQHIYFQYYSELVTADHNPHHWYYFSFLPFVGTNNIVLQVTAAFFRALPISLAARALLTNMVTAWLCLWLLSLSIYCLFRHLQRSQLMSLLASVIVTFTGFHLIGVRQFDYLYLLSFAAVGPVLICFEKLLKTDRPLFWALLAGLIIGVSLLAASNIPLFYYLPFFFLLAPLQLGKNYSALFRAWSFQLLAVLVGILIAAATLWPGIVFLPLTNRELLQFSTDDTISFVGKILSFFLREWWVLSPKHTSQLDIYLGLPILLLAGLGLSRLKGC